MTITEFDSALAHISNEIGLTPPADKLFWDIVNGAWLGRGRNSLRRSYKNTIKLIHSYEPRYSKVASIIDLVLSWNSTPQGFHYWQRVFIELNKMGTKKIDTVAQNAAHAINMFSQKNPS